MWVRCLGNGPRFCVHLPRSSLEPALIPLEKQRRREEIESHHYGSTQGGMEQSPIANELVQTPNAAGCHLRKGRP